MTVVDCAKVEFEVLRAPVLNYEVPSPENPGYTNTIYFDAIDNAVRYNLRRNGLTPPGYNESSTRFSYAVKDGEQVDYLVKACGDGVHFLDSCDSNLVSLRSLVAPRIGFDNVTNSLYLVEESEPNYGVGGYWLTYNGYISSCKLGQDIYETMPIVANQNNLVGARAFTIDQTEDNDTVWAPQGIYFIASGDSESLNISRIDSQTLVSVENVSNNLDYHDNLILQPSHGREYNLRLKIEVDSVVYNFETVQGTRVLRCDTCLKNHAGEHDEACYEINYSYDYAGKYYIPLLNSMFDSIVPNEEFKNVLVNVEYFDAPGTMNAKSGFWTQNVELKFTNQTVLERRNQDIVIKNIDADRDYSNFALLLNGDNLMMLDETCEKKENEIFVSMDKIYEALGDKFVETNSICAVTINNLDEKTISRKSEPIYFEIYKTVFQRL